MHDGRYPLFRLAGPQNGPKKGSCANLRERFLILMFIRGSYSVKSQYIHTLRMYIVHMIYDQSAAIPLVLQLSQSSPRNRLPHAASMRPSNEVEVDEEISQYYTHCHNECLQQAYVKHHHSKEHKPRPLAVIYSVQILYEVRCTLHSLERQ